MGSKLRRRAGHDARRSRHRLAVVVLALSLGTALAVPSLGAQEEDGLTPSHVHQHARRLLAEITLLREHQGVTDAPRDPGTQINKLPIHVYQKAVELMDKVSRYQSSLGMSPMTVRPLPFETLSPAVVLDAVDHVLVNLRAVKEELGLNREIAPQGFAPGRTPTEVYELLWRASFMLDGLTTALQPSDVYAKERQALADLRTIAERIDLQIPQGEERVTDKQPKDVLMENYVNMYRLARVQRAMGMEPFHVPPLPGGEIAPSNVYDTAGIIIGELHRIKARLDVLEPTPPPTDQEDKTPSDVFATAKLLQRGLSELLDAAEGGLLTTDATGRDSDG